MNISSIQFVLSTGNYLRYKQMKIIIIGGVAGGATTAARIRRVDETAEIVLLEKGNMPLCLLKMSIFAFQ